MEKVLKYERNYKWTVWAIYAMYGVFGLWSIYFSLLVTPLFLARRAGGGVGWRTQIFR